MLHAPGGSQATGHTGDGKTAILLLLAAHIALGRSIGGNEVKQGRVLHFAGENPDDTLMRWIAMSTRMGFDLDTIPVHFVRGVVNISEVMNQAKAEALELHGFELVIVDTSAAYFFGDEANRLNHRIRGILGRYLIGGNQCPKAEDNPAPDARKAPRTSGPLRLKTHWSREVNCPRGLCFV